MDWKDVDYSLLAHCVMRRFAAVNRFPWDEDFDVGWNWPSFVVRARPYDRERD